MDHRTELTLALIELAGELDHVRLHELEQTAAVLVHEAREEREWGSWQQGPVWPSDPNEDPLR